MRIEDKICVVTGAAGFIGSHLVDGLLRKGAAKVIGMDNFVAGKYANIRHLAKERRFSLVKADIRDSKKISPYLLKSDFVFNLAASKLVVSHDNPRIDMETNIGGVFNILEILRGNKKARLIHASTGSVLGSSDKPMPEDWPPNPATLYGISKLTAERYCMFYFQEFGLNVSVVRYFHVYGPRQDYQGPSGVVNIFLSRVLSGKPPIVNGDGRQVRCFTYVEDDVAATIMLAEKKCSIGQIYNVASPVRMRVKALAELVIKKYAKSSLRVKYAPARRGENLRPVPDTEKIEKLGFWAKYSFTEGLEKTKIWIEKELKGPRH
ncbi:MAG: GDP-mannose 4,6-dehydratase [Candidatus Omnitrophota bacterium]